VCKGVGLLFVFVLWGFGAAVVVLFLYRLAGFSFWGAGAAVALPL
jgi:hypothetical protein